MPAREFHTCVPANRLRNARSAQCADCAPIQIVIAIAFSGDIHAPFREASAGMSGPMSRKVSLANAARLLAAGFSSAVSHRNARG